MAKAPINVSIAGDYNDKDINRAIRDLNSLKTGGGDTSKSMSGLSSGMKALGGVMAATFSVALIADFFSSSIAGALADEKAMKSLEIALNNVGAAHAVAPVEAFLDALARESGIADDVLRPSFQRLVTATGDVALSQKAVALAMDISAGTGRDLEAVSLALAKGFSGSTTALGKLGAGIDLNIIKSKDMDAITAALSAKFAGQASAAAETYQGKLNRISVAAGEGTELIGTSLLKAVDDLAESFGGVGGATDAIDTASQAIADFITGAAAGVSPIADFASGINESTGSTFDFADAIKLAYPLFIPLINATENLVDAGAALRVGNVQQSKATTKLRDEYITATGAIVGFVAAEFEAEDAVGQTTNAIITQFTAMSRIDQAMQDAGSRALFVATADDTLRLAAADAASAVSGLGGSSGGAAKDLFTFKEALAEVNAAGLEKLNANLKAAQDEFDGFRTSIAGGISGQLDFGSAIDEAKKGGTGIVDGIVAQAKGIEDFGEQLQLLLKTSLSKESFLAVSALTAERGAALATELLGANGAALIAQLNTSVAAVGAVAEAVGLQAAEKWYGTGKKIAEDSITGFTDFMGKDGMGRKQLMNTMDRLADAATRQVRIDVMVTRSINEIVTQIRQNITGPQAREHGGPVSSGRSYMVGEAGPELFTPSSSGNITPNSAMGGNTYNINVNAGVGDPRAIGQQIVEYVKKFEKANGPVFAAA